MLKLSLFALSAAILTATAVDAASFSNLQVSAKTQTPLTAQPKIVGGIEAEQDNWPWMTAFVVTFESTSTSLEVGGVSYSTESFNFSPAGQVSAEIISCGLGDTVCSDAEAKICLIERGEINFSEKANNCEAGGGIGAIIYNNIDGIISGTLGEDFSGSIPVVAITRQDGLDILEQTGAQGSLSVSAESNLEQDASCGATFLGDKWVLTAAHCVDTPSASLFKMNVGEYDLSDGAENAVGISNIFVHPLYDTDQIDNDIAIVELNSSLSSPAVQIADKALTDQLAIENSMATVIGWGGRTGYAASGGETSDFPDILHQVDLQLSTNQQCKETLAASYTRDSQNDVIYSADDIYISDAMICAAIAQGGKGSCQGDSGGPLIVDTNTGPQQVGIVSWGIGCAAEGYPGVYTRVAEFKDWLNAISDGIAITQKHDFTVSPLGAAQLKQLQVFNNSELSAGLTFDIDGDAAFTVDAGTCTTLDPGESCEITVNYQPEAAGDAQAYVVISSDNPDVPASKSLVLGQSIGTASELDGVVGAASESVTWFSGGDKAWETNTIEGVQSGNIIDAQQSILLAKVEGEGQLTFDWAVSSEENVDSPEEPYDALYLYVNGELIDFISGEVDYTQYTLDLVDGTNLISWIYTKDPAVSEFDDKGYLRNVVFTPTAVTTPTPPVVTPPTNPNDRSGGGGSIGWLMLPLFAVFFLRRR